MRISFSFLCIILLFTACQVNEKGSEEENVESKKYYSITRDEESKITKTYSSDASFDYNIETDYYYDANDSLKKKIIKKEYSDSIVSDSIIYSYVTTDTLKKETLFRYMVGKVVNEIITMDYYENDKLVKSARFDKSYNKYKDYVDTISFYSTYNYLENKLQSKKEHGEYLTTSNDFYYENDLLKRKVLLDVVENDTLSKVDFSYKDGYVFKTVETDYLMDTKLTSIYNNKGFLIESYWQGSDNKADTVKVNRINNENKIEYYWDEEYYPSFNLNTGNSKSR
jgi:hypothetical protein